MRFPLIDFNFRCAQPLSGFNARCAEDENLIEAIRTTNTSVDCLYIVDTRPYINAMANRMQGKGSEDMRNYANAQKYTFDVENIHAMRNSQSKLLEGKSTRVNADVASNDTFSVPKAATVCDRLYQGR